MQTYTVKNDNGRDIKFTGDFIGYAATSDDSARSDYSGSLGRWTELILYRTSGGKYVASIVNHSNWDGERDSHDAVVCETQEEVIEFFGDGQLSKELYADAEIDACLMID